MKLAALSFLFLSLSSLSAQAQDGFRPIDGLVGLPSDRVIELIRTADITPIHFEYENRGALEFPDIQARLFFRNMGERSVTSGREIAFLFGPSTGAGLSEFANGTVTPAIAGAAAVEPGQIGYISVYFTSRDARSKYFNHCTKKSVALDVGDDGSRSGHKILRFQGPKGQANESNDYRELQTYFYSKERNPCPGETTRVDLPQLPQIPNIDWNL